MTWYSWLIGAVGTALCIMGAVHDVMDTTNLSIAQHMLLTGITLVALALK